MALSEIELPEDSRPLPPRIEALLADADARIAAFLVERIRGTIPGFVPSDFRAVCHALRFLRDSHLASGESFCEWGSGFGVVTCLAAYYGFHAHGIEIQEDLVAEAEALAEAHSFDVEFACGTFVPEGGEGIVDQVGEFEWLEAGGSSGYELLEIDLEGFDVIFAYPWPGEEQVVEQLFDEFGAVGALLATFHGDEGVRLRRKVRR